ncbi:MAG: hypothetical protein HGA76_08930, partial [Candidatus Firestonebacteria bacterium]|nr:hypothetical protein [Candidatus Firestonebacteria bacterium]
MTGSKQGESVTQSAHSTIQRRLACWVMFAGLVLSTHGAWAQEAPAPPDRFLAWDPVAREYVARMAVSPDTVQVKTRGMRPDAGALADFAAAAPARVRALGGGRVETRNFSAPAAMAQGRALHPGQRLYWEYTYKQLSPEFHRRLPDLSPAAGLERAALRQSQHLQKNDNRLELSLDNKLDGQWYRLSATIPTGYTVRQIVRADGRQIINRGHRARGTGEVVGENIAWYLDGNQLVFFDDPVFGYTIILDPPRPNNSLFVEIASSSGAGYGYGGQISAIGYPYSGGTPAVAIDHAGREEDQIANQIDGAAGSKLALRFTAAGATRQYGNPGYTNIPTFRVFHTGADGDFQETSRTYTQMNETPGGILESVIVTQMTTPAGAPIPVSITQKVIIRGNMKWFATIYYVQNLSGATGATALRFYQGMDWNFNGDYNGDNCAYDNTNDIVYGFKPTGNPVSYGGFSGFSASNAHDVNLYYNRTPPPNGMWNDIANNTLNNAATYNGDAGTALRWDNAALAAGATWAVPVIWAYGNTINS